MFEDDERFRYCQWCAKSSTLSRPRRWTVVHARDCEAVGTSRLEGCSWGKRACSRRYEHDSLTTNHVSKLAVDFEKELGCTQDWEKLRRTGNPLRIELEAQYMGFTTKQQNQAGSRGNGEASTSDVEESSAHDLDSDEGAVTVQEVGGK